MNKRTLSTWVMTVASLSVAAESNAQQTIQFGQPAVSVSQSVSQAGRYDPEPQGIRLIAAPYVQESAPTGTQVEGLAEPGTDSVPAEGEMPRDEDVRRKPLNIEDEAKQLTERSGTIGTLKLPTLTVPDLAIADVGTGKLPRDVTEGKLPPAIPLPSGYDRDLSQPLVFNTKMWLPAEMAHNPLYFEDIMLERHGQSAYPYLQPYLSGARLLGQTAMLPYQMTLNGPCEAVSNLGRYRPGSPAPCLRQRLPYDVRALRNQLLTTGAAAALLPL